MMSAKILAAVQAGQKIAPGVLAHGDPDPGPEQCDRCMAGALVLLEQHSCTLAMCGHHYNEHWSDLLADGWDVTRDVRHKLVPAPVIPGN